MSEKSDTQHEEQGLQEFLDDVRRLVVETIASTSLGFLAHECRSLSLGGKMLRSRLAWRLRDAADVPRHILLQASAAVEMIHTASILHDDVIDGGVLRRGMPTFWKEKGPAGAILFGDLLLFKAIELMCQLGDGELTHQLVKLTGQVCEAESEQEIVLQGTPARIEHCLSIARRKTGALFAFIGFAGGGQDPVLRQRLQEAGYQFGTAYQLADDLLDAMGSESLAGKTLGTDRQREIISAAELETSENGVVTHAIRTACERAIALLDEYPYACIGAKVYLEHDLGPAIEQLLKAGNTHSPAY